MSEGASKIFVFPVITISLLFAVLGLFFPTFLSSIQYPVLGILVVTIGLPHGATDYLLFKRINGHNLTRKQIIKFFGFYLFAVFGFLVLWLVLPVLSFVIFILISSYHFGQSNWENVALPKTYTFLLHILWGAFAIGGSVLWHWQESKIIIGQVIGALPDISSATMDKIQLAIVALNIISILLLKLVKKISTKRLWNELGKLAILSSMFYLTPMMIGFTLYFTLWHSLGSMLSQVSFYKKRWPNFTVTDYYHQAAPYTILAVVGFIIMINGHQYLLPNVSPISTFLVFIACVTLPHIFFVEESYN